MKIRNYIYYLAVLLMVTSCNKSEDVSSSALNNDDIRFIANLQQTTAISPLALGDEMGDKEALPYVNNIHIRKVDKSGNSLTGLFHVRTGNYGTLDMEVAEGVTETAMKWSDKNNAVDFFAWTTPTGVTIADINTSTTGTVNFGCEIGEGNKPNTGETYDTFDDKNVTPLEVFISAYKSSSFNESPSVNLDFTHIVSKVSIIVHWWNNSVITDQVTLTFPYINEIWNVEQKQEMGTTSKFAITDAEITSDILSLELNSLFQIKEDYRTFYLPPIATNDLGDFEIEYNNEMYYGSLSQIGGFTALKAGEHITLDIHLNPNFNAGGNAWINPWKEVKSAAYANPYRGIYTLEGLKILKQYENNLANLPDSLYIPGTGADNGKMLVRLYNDLDVSGLTDAINLPNNSNIIFDGQGHIVTTTTGKVLFGTVGTGTILQNTRIAGDGQLATSVDETILYNCHAGTANLVGKAIGTTTFDFCSAENTSGTLMNEADGTKITVKNSFVASSKTVFTNIGTVTANNSFITDSNSNDGKYWSTNVETAFSNGVIANTTNKLIDLLNAASAPKTWVYVYGKNYPVMRVK